MEEAEEVKKELKEEAEQEMVKVREEIMDVLIKSQNLRKLCCDKLQQLNSTRETEVTLNTKIGLLRRQSDIDLKP
eukprot:CAMPEP_0170503576 /NCGR_PEP_ID=MMETSP0208-20121228/45227_1 /TAXON_ID=197538 /ORGANISM="Strombidium inclinatum, Strain S3" /LENGTH=74 /DNA_ID=CAMNT_0010783301 /DNA_START=204 /DNA_END=428 /DNA_ORIENTATION=-